MFYLSLIFLIKKNFFFFFALLGLSLDAKTGLLQLQCTGFSLWGLLTAGASHCGGFSCCRTQALGVQASVAVARGLSCPTAHGILPDQGSNSCPLHWRQLLNHWTTREVRVFSCSLWDLVP